jgi:DNA polymerase (family 10)
MTQVIHAAAAAGVAMEINAQVDRLDLDDLHARRARDAGARIVISSDSHGTGGFGALRWAVTIARRAWLMPADVLNTRSVDDLSGALRRHHP